jgi:DNA-binding response OmpR family regulator
MGDFTMVYTPALDGTDTAQPVLDRAGLGVLPAKRATLRFGGLAMDSATGAVTWQGHSVSLPVRERELLGALLKRAGQIVSCEQLAAMVGASTKAVEGGVESLRIALRREGISTMPTRVDGCGYILWRM